MRKRGWHKAIKVLVALSVVVMLATVLFSEAKPVAASPGIGINNPQSAANSSIGNSITLSSYAVPSGVGSNLILVVWVQAEYGSHSEASSCTFSGSSMTKITGASTLFYSSSYYTGGAMFWKAVSPGDSGNIVATFPGTAVNRGSIHAVTLSRVDTSGPKASTCKTATSSPFYTSLSGLTAGDMVMSGGTNGQQAELTAYGTGHVRDSSQLPSSCAGAQGHKEATESSSGNIGWSTTSINRGIVSLAAFAPLAEGTWQSYSNSQHTVPCEDFDAYPDEHTVYMYGTGFTPNAYYKVIYWDGLGNKRTVDGSIQAGGDGSLGSQHEFVESDQSGDWHSTVYYPDTYDPSSYSSTDPNIVADDTSYTGGYAFHMEATAIPEFSTIISAIAVAGLCFGIYYWMRKRHRRQAGMA